MTSKWKCARPPVAAGVVALRQRPWLSQPAVLLHLALLLQAALPPQGAEAAGEAEAAAAGQASREPHPRLAQSLPAAAGAAPRHRQFRACSGRSGWWRTKRRLFRGRTGGRLERPRDQLSNHLALVIRVSQ
jgi:hypothetical protein